MLLDMYDIISSKEYPRIGVRFDEYHCRTSLNHCDALHGLGAS